MVIQYILLQSEALISDENAAMIVADASMSFLSDKITKNLFKKVFSNVYCISFDINEETVEWMQTGKKRILLKVDNAEMLENAIQKINGFGLQENTDYFRIENNGSLFAVGFTPMNEKRVNNVIEKLQLN